MPEERSDSPPQSDRPLNLELEVTSLESDGSWLTHRITVKRFRPSLDGVGALLGAHCHRQGAFLEFESALLGSCVDVASGEAVDNLPLHLSRAYAQSRAGRIERIKVEFADELAVLLHLGRADGLLQRREKELIASYLVERFLPDTVSAEEIAAHLAWVKAPSPQAFSHALGRLAGQDVDLRRRLVKRSESVIDVKESRDGFEQEAFNQLVASLLDPG